MFIFDIGTVMYFVSIAVNNVFFIGSTRYVTAFSKDIEANFNEMNDELTSKKINEKKKSQLQVQKIDFSERLIETISLHNEMFKYISIFLCLIFRLLFRFIIFFLFIYRTMKNIGDLMSVILFNVLITCVLLFAFFIFYMDQNFVINIKLMYTLQCSITYLILCYVYCFFSE